MATVTHVIPTKEGWIVKKSGRKPSGVFFTRSEAKKQAVRVSRAAKAGQVVVHSRTGGFYVTARHGLPKMQKSPYKSTLGTTAIRQAVGKVVAARLMAE
jgi:hypothetical protein